MPYFAGWLEDVLTWVGSEGTPPPLPPSPPPSPPAPPSPAPPPFPPASSWFMGIKPIKMPTPVKPDDAMTASEISNAEKAFYNNQWSKTFALQGGGSVSLEAKAPMKKITVCSSVAKKERRQLMYMDDKFKYEPGLPGGPPTDFEPPKGGSGVGSGSGSGYDKYIQDMKLHNPFMKDVSAMKIKEPVQYIDDFMYRSYHGGIVSAAPVKIDVESLMIYEKERSIMLWQEVAGEEEKVPMFYYSTSFVEPGYSRPTVPPVPSPPPLSVCKSKLVEIDAQGSSASLSATKLSVLKVKLDSTLGARRAIENLDASSWSKSGITYSIGSPGVSMSDTEMLKESAFSVEKFLSEQASTYA